MKKLSDWERKTGIDFLKKIGIKKSYKVLDFGCNNGNYTIPISTLVGNKGIVFAIDENKSALNELQKKSKLIKSDNIKIVHTNGELYFNITDDFFDFVMFYDVLHYLKLQQRTILYKEIFRVLKSNAILSVHPKHIIGNFPLNELQNVKLDELISEIEYIGFKYSEKICSELSHDGYLEEGCVINFVKKY